MYYNRDSNGRFSSKNRKKITPKKPKTSTPSNKAANTPEVSAVLTNSGLTVLINGKHYVINSSHGHYHQIIQALKDKDYKKVEVLLDKPRFIENATNGRVKVIGGIVYLNNQEMHNALTKRIIQMVDLGLDPQPLMNFLERLEKNPSFNSREQLFKFLDASDLPVLPDGRFLAYKSVRDDYMDKHTNTVLNKPGMVVSMPRSSVDDNPGNTCSHGLHVCSQAYGMYGQRLLHVAVDPAHVVSVPNNYKNAKMRVCEYEVLRDAPEGFESWDNRPVYAN